MKTYIITNDERYAAQQCEDLGINMHSEDVIVVRTERAIEGRRMPPGTKILDLTHGYTLDTLHRQDRIWDVIKRNAASTGGRIIASPYSPVAHQVIPTQILDLSTRTVFERAAQIEKWGEQHHEFRRRDGHPDLDRGPMYRRKEEHYKGVFAHQTPEGSTWDVILLEEVYEALGEDDPKKRVEELIQVAAVALAIAEDLEGRDDRG